MDSVIDLDDKIKLGLDQYKLITGDQGEQASFFSFSLYFTLLINIFSIHKIPASFIFPLRYIIPHRNLDFHELER